MAEGSVVIIGKLADKNGVGFRLLDHHDVETTTAAGSGASMKQTLLLMGWQPTTTAGCGDQEKSEIGTTTKHDFLACPFGSATAENAFLHNPMPDNWDAGTVTFRVWWFCKTGYVVTTSDGVAWTLKASSYGDGDAIDATFGTGVTVTDTGDANNDLNKTADSAALTIGNSPAAGDMIHWVLTRTVSDAADDWAADAYPVAVVVEYGVSALSS